MRKQRNPDTRYGIVRFIWNYIKFRSGASSRHKVHSPAVYALIEDLRRKTEKTRHPDIENVRAEFRSDQTEIDMIDHGKDGLVITKTISYIAKTSLKPRAMAELIARICLHFKVKSALELGTSLGTTSAYIARSITGKLTTIEGDKNVQSTAISGWNKLDISNINPIQGSFDHVLNKGLDEQQYDLIYVDGHHHEQATLAYFKRLIKYTSNNTIFVFDDIHWSPGMESAWKKIQESTEVSTSIDLFWIGIVFLRKELSSEHFRLKI